MQNELSSDFDSLTTISYEMKVGLTLRALRNFFAMSQTDLASLCGVSRPTLSSLERGTAVRHSNAETLEKVVRFFISLGVEIELDGSCIRYRFSEAAVRLALRPDKM